VIAPHKEKYHDLYWAMAATAARQSVARRTKVGCVIVAPTGMISIGWNGMPPGFDNNCEVEDKKTVRLTSTKEDLLVGLDLITKPEVIHAERNAIDKMTRQGVPVEGSILFTTLAPCLECAKSMHGLGFAHVYYRDTYRCTAGLQFLEQAGVPVSQPQGVNHEHSESCKDCTA